LIGRDVARDNAEHAKPLPAAEIIPFFQGNAFQAANAVNSAITCHFWILGEQTQVIIATRSNAANSDLESGFHFGFSLVAVEMSDSDSLYIRKNCVVCNGLVSL
jgi:hypothetical protein